MILTTRGRASKRSEKTVNAPDESRAGSAAYLCCSETAQMSRFSRDMTRILRNLRIRTVCCEGAQLIPTVTMLSPHVKRRMTSVTCWPASMGVVNIAQARSNSRGKKKRK